MNEIIVVVNQVFLKPLS
ncbi:hypothetical protein Goklo_019843 [Gossypium klotzschianum]|uniref:Uncharacterized protein n=1 Tax=Gossypium klotzschianum TaxID=34286 RepID=A0A7J8UQ97_9ROSI|nr:hypothetical protein [Gossypium klotzschianum]